MALTPKNRFEKPGSRGLIQTPFISEGNSPALELALDPALPVTFHNVYNVTGNQAVVVGFGHLVSLMKSPVVDSESRKLRTGVTLSNDRPVGIAMINYIQRRTDLMEGNHPVITRDGFIRLPYAMNADVAKMLWMGAYYDEASNKRVQVGDLLTWSRNPETKGKFIKFDEAVHKQSEIIGEVWEVEANFDVNGLVKYAQWDSAYWKSDTMGVDPNNYTPAPANGHYPFDPELRDFYNQTAKQWYSTQYHTASDALGIKGLTDGANRAQTVFEHSDSIAAGTPAGTKVNFVPSIYGIKADSVQVFVDGVEVVDKTRFTTEEHPDLPGRQRVVFTTLAADAGKSVTVKFLANFPGMPAGADFVGSMGYVKIVLKF